VANFCVSEDRNSSVVTPIAAAKPKIVTELMTNPAAKRPLRRACKLQDCPFPKDIVPRNDTPQGLKSCANPATAASARSEMSFNGTLRQR